VSARTATTVWVVRLRPDGELGWLRAAEALNEEDLVRTASLRFEDDRHRLAVSRLALRELVHTLLPVSNERVIMEHPRGQAPRVCGEDLQLSLAHAGHLVVCAASPQPVGVDVEVLPAPIPSAALLERYLSPAEQASLEKLSPAEKARAFLQIWVRKEAILKAGHVGMGIDLRLVDVGGHSVSVPDVIPELQLTDIELGPEAVAAVASHSSLGLRIDYPNGASPIGHHHTQIGR
jgi:4'-phosphopantetheinyl transferase